jgi:hypothetical protein
VGPGGRGAEAMNWRLFLFLCRNLFDLESIAQFTERNNLALNTGTGRTYGAIHHVDTHKSNLSVAFRTIDVVMAHFSLRRQFLAQNKTRGNAEKVRVARQRSRIKI